MTKVKKMKNWYQPNMTLENNLLCTCCCVGGSYSVAG